MIVMVCVDNSLGMLFSNRRQSRDKVLINKIAEMSCISRLFINEFSRPLFESFESQIIIVNDDFLEMANNGDYCFVENCSLAPYIEKIEKLIVYKWNREYPSDFSLDIDLSQWSLISTTDFKGNSHDKITMEVYKK